MENKKLLKRLIITILVIIVIIIAILFLVGGNKEIKLNEATHKQVDPIINEKNEYKKEESPTRFYTVEAALQKYLDLVHLDYENQLKDEEIEEGKSTKASIYGVSKQEEKIDKILNLLDVNFIKENNITNKNLDKYISIDEDEIDDATITKMNVLEKEQFKTYGIEVQYITKSEKTNIEYFIVTLDEFNSTYMVEPLKDIENINEIELDANKNYDKIENKENINKYSYVRIDDAEMSAKYFRQYKEMMIKNTEKAYNMLAKEYRDKRFGNYDKFKQYIEKNKQEISRTYIKQYLVNKTENGKEYICKGGNENVYVFNATSVTDYTVQLDTYTIETKEFKETYDMASEQNKIAMNIDKWILMLNNRDYEAAYNVLDETFRNENFGSLESFEEYMREMYPKYYNVDIQDVKKESNAYVTELYILQKDDAVEKISIKNNIMMQLKDNREFVMSFYVRRH